MMSPDTSSLKRIALDVKLGRDVKIYDFVNLYGCEIGDNSKIGTFVEIQKNSKIGRNCKISSHTFICEGVTVEDDVFIGHGEDWVCIPTKIEKGASIGSGSTLLCGITIGQNAIVGAGSVVIADVPANAVVAGNPAKRIRKMNVNSN
jgi:acetyltransferase-like isoleucine patch superfamily enzyme